jgi:hypothetical protein
MGEFPEQSSDEGQPSGDSFDLVGAVPRQPPHGLGLSQALRAAVQMRIEFFNVMAVRVHDTQSGNISPEMPGL